jgi:urease subunit alpha
MTTVRPNGLTQRDTVRNDALPQIEVDREMSAVRVDGVHATVPAARDLPLTQLYFFSQGPRLAGWFCLKACGR